MRLLMARAALSVREQDVARQALIAATRVDGERPEAWQGLARVSADANDVATQIDA